MTGESSDVPTTASPPGGVVPGWLWPGGLDQVREPRRPAVRWPYSERHVQCVWFDPRLRPKRLQTMNGAWVRIENPGLWNQEAGPDFIGASGWMESDGRPLTGDVEVHVRPDGWNQHDHQSDPRYHNVRLHVTWFPGSLPASDLPPGTVQLSLQQNLRDSPEFSLDAVDPTAYPYATRSTLPPCASILRDWRPELRQAMLDAAGEERLRRKADRLLLRIGNAGPEQTLYEEFLAALGYKHNKVPFRALANRVPLSAVREHSDGDPTVGYALLMGCAGLLPAEANPAWDEASKQFHRRTWAAWWRLRNHFDTPDATPLTWRLSGLRPANHPQRRLMAAARLFVPSSTLAVPIDGLAEALADIHDPYWDHRLSFGGNRQIRPVALLGQNRIRAVIVNVVVPYLLATGADAQRCIAHLPAEAENAIIRRTAHDLFGPDHAPSLYRTGLRRQGLIQVFEDFCLNDRSRCRSCPLPEALRTFQR